mmetsp:Transcript_103510/g.205738  ORF Transcript_103510/g.205738 Transcript_103510/m.205738 type:complete len:342 (+) Transcript_103510:223-1248(+)
MPRGHSCTTDMAKSRPRNRLQRSGCCQTPSTSVEFGLRKPGIGLSWQWPSNAGRRRPRCGSANSVPACVRKALVTPPPPSPSSPSSPRYFMQSLPGQRSWGVAESKGPRADFSSWSRSTLMVTRRPTDAKDRARLKGSIKSGPPRPRVCRRSSACAMAAARECHRSSSSKSRSMWCSNPMPARGISSFTALSRSSRNRRRRRSRLGPSSCVGAACAAATAAAAPSRSKRMVQGSSPRRCSTIRAAWDLSRPRAMAPAPSASTERRRVASKSASLCQPIAGQVLLTARRALKMPVFMPGHTKSNGKPLSISTIADQTWSLAEASSGPSSVPEASSSSSAEEL